MKLLITATHWWLPEKKWFLLKNSCRSLWKDLHIPFKYSKYVLYVCALRSIKCYYFTLDVEKKNSWKLCLLVWKITIFLGGGPSLKLWGEGVASIPATNSHPTLVLFELVQCCQHCDNFVFKPNIFTCKIQGKICTFF